MHHNESSRPVQYRVTWGRGNTHRVFSSLDGVLELIDRVKMDHIDLQVMRLPEWDKVPVTTLPTGLFRLILSCRQEVSVQ